MNMRYAKEEEIDNMLRIIYDRYDKIDILINKYIHLSK